MIFSSKTSCRCGWPSKIPTWACCLSYCKLFLSSKRFQNNPMWISKSISQCQWDYKMNRIGWLNQINQLEIFVLKQNWLVKWYSCHPGCSRISSAAKACGIASTQVVGQGRWSKAPPWSHRDKEMFSGHKDSTFKLGWSWAISVSLPHFHKKNKYIYILIIPKSTRNLFFWVDQEFLV